MTDSAQFLFGMLAAVVIPGIFAPVLADVSNLWRPLTTFVVLAMTVAVALAAVGVALQEPALQGVACGLGLLATCVAIAWGMSKINKDA